MAGRPMVWLTGKHMAGLVRPAKLNISQHPFGQAQATHPLQQVLGGDIFTELLP